MQIFSLHRLLNRQPERKVCTRAKPLYHNCFLEAPDGDLLCTCAKKKAEWYVERGLGKVVTEEPYTVRLLFEPAGRAVGSVGKYYQTPKANQCVVCGDSNSYIRKNIIPREYRRNFPCKYHIFIIWIILEIWFSSESRLICLIEQLLWKIIHHTMSFCYARNVISSVIWLT